MEIAEILMYIVAGFAPTMLAMEVSWRLAFRRVVAGRPAASAEIGLQ
ncbi:MAG: hypothetical protein ABI361_08210 [Nitrososphaera sp.]|jgi:hypothetical protein